MSTLSKLCKEFDTTLYEGPILQIDVDYNVETETLNVSGSYMNLSRDLIYTPLICMTNDNLLKPRTKTVVTARVCGRSYFQTGNQLQITGLEEGFLKIDRPEFT